MRTFTTLALLNAAAIFGHGSLARAYTFVNIADVTAIAPAGAFSQFYTPSVSGNTVAFNADYGTNQSGIFTGTGGPLTTIAKSGNGAPVGVFNSSFSDPTISGGTVAFSADFDNGSREGVFTSNGGPLTPIALTGNSAPTGAFTGFGGPTISGNSVVFEGFYGTELTGIFQGSGGALTTIAKIGDPAPIGTISDFGFFSSVGVSGNAVAFVAYYDNDNEVAVFHAEGGSLTPVAKSGDPAPIGTFDAFYGTSISNGEIAFGASFFTDDLIGVFKANGGSVTTIGKVGDPAPVGEFNWGDIPAISHGVVAFEAHYDDSDGRGIFVSTGGPLSPVIKSGDPLFGGTVERVDFSERGLDPDGSGNIAFQYSLTDGRLGIALAMPSGADFNGDGRVSSDDLAPWKAGFGLSSAAKRMQGNADNDQDVDGADFLLWQRQLGTLPSAVPASFAAPEPNAGALFLISVSVLLCRRSQSHGARN